MTAQMIPITQLTMMIIMDVEKSKIPWQESSEGVAAKILLIYITTI